MNSKHFRNLHESFLNAVIADIKEKIGHSRIQANRPEKPIFISNPKGKYNERLQVKSFTIESIILQDGMKMYWNKIKSFDDLIYLMEYIEEWFESKSNDSFMICWSLSDIEDCALEIEENTNDGVPLFDRSKFPFALKMLEDYHDCNLGINWYDIKHHLKKYCLT